MATRYMYLYALTSLPYKAASSGPWQNVMYTHTLSIVTYRIQSHTHVHNYDVISGH